MAATICPTPIGMGRCQGTCQRPFFEGQVDRGEQMGLPHHELEVRQPLGADRGQLVFGLPDSEGRMENWSAGTRRSAAGQAAPRELPIESCITPSPAFRKGDFAEEMRCRALVAALLPTFYAWEALYRAEA
jgi:hypothetical protein